MSAVTRYNSRPTYGFLQQNTPVCITTILHLVPMYARHEFLAHGNLIMQSFATGQVHKCAWFASSTQDCSSASREGTPSMLLNPKLKVPYFINRTKSRLWGSRLTQSVEKLAKLRGQGRCSREHLHQQFRRILRTGDSNEVLSARFRLNNLTASQNKQHSSS